MELLRQIYINKLRLIAIQIFDGISPELIEIILKNVHLQNPYAITREIPSDFVCVICFDNNQRPRIIKTECKHYFHQNCLNNNILTGSTTCPICRTELFECTDL